MFSCFTEAIHQRWRHLENHSIQQSHRCPSTIGLSSWKHFHFSTVNKICNFSCHLFATYHLNSLSSHYAVNIKEIAKVGLCVLHLIDAMICPQSPSDCSLLSFLWHIGCAKKHHTLSAIKGCFPLPFLPPTSFLFHSFLHYALVVFQPSGDFGAISGHPLWCARSLHPFWFGGIRSLVHDVLGLLCGSPFKINICVH